MYVPSETSIFKVFLVKSFPLTIIFLADFQYLCMMSLKVSFISPPTWEDFTWGVIFDILWYISLGTESNKLTVCLRMRPTFARMMSSSMLSILWFNLVMFISPYSARASAIFSRLRRIKIWNKICTGKFCSSEIWSRGYHLKKLHLFFEFLLPFKRFSLGNFQGLHVLANYLRSWGGAEKTN